MATPMTPDEIRSALRKWEIPFREVPGWDTPTSGRDDETGLVFGPVHGCVTHHTGDDAPDTANRSIIIHGRSDLPGPLAQFGLNDDGVVDLITCHRANHAGGGDPKVLQQVMDESYGDYPSPSHYHQGSTGAADGNDCFYGCEVYYSGLKSMTSKQYNSIVGLWTAICDHYGWSAKSVIGHKEWSDQKWDPGQIDMKVLRADIQKRLDAGSQGAQITPNITKAIKANILYRRALDRIKAPALQDQADQWRKELRAQYRALVEKERK